MSVFDCQVITPLNVPNPGTDQLLPPAGALSYGSITSFSSLAATNGTDTVLIHGDHDCQTNGNESTRITENRSHTIGGNQDKKISGNKTESVIQNFLQTTMGNLHRTIIGATNDLFTAAHTIEHKANQFLKEPTAYFHEVTENFVKTREKHDEYQIYQLYCGQLTNFIGVNIDFKGVQTAAIGLLGEAHGLCHAEKVAETEMKDVQNKIHALDNRIGAIQPVVHVAMFHEVSITQKILIVGVNQYI
jgi:hypothetical protein